MSTKNLVLFDLKYKNCDSLPEHSHRLVVISAVNSIKSGEMSFARQEISSPEIILNVNNEFLFLCQPAVYSMYLQCRFTI